MPEKEYISREALLERIDDIWDCADLVFEPNDHCCRADDCRSCKWAETKKAIRKIIANFPAADVRPVVLCRDCKWYEINELKKDGTEDRRYKPSVCMLAEQRRDPNHFCADGKKREES